MAKGRETADNSSLLEDAREKMSKLLEKHEPVPLDEDAERELDRIEKQAREEN